MISVRNAEGGERVLGLEEFEEEIRLGNISPAARVCFPLVTGDRWVDARDLDVFRRLYAPARLHFTRTFSLGAFPSLTVALCITQIVVYLSVAGFRRTVALDPLISAGAKMQPNIFELGETWRLITANFLHRDVLHLLFNVFFFFNVGGTIENAYRLRDYVLIIIASALGTTLVSVLMSSHPSVGASGVVLGFFGSASIFGYKYGDILPKRYRRYFGSAVLPYALFILYMGLATETTDNWGHLGGLLAGVIVTVPMRPKLLHVFEPSSSPLAWPSLSSWVLSWLFRSSSPRTAPSSSPSSLFLWSRLTRRSALWSGAGPWVLSLGLLAGVWAVGGFVRLWGPTLVEQETDDTGLVTAYPKRWSDGQNHLGMPAKGNSLGASLAVVVEHTPETQRAPSALSDLRRRFMQQTVGAMVREGDIASVQVLGEKPFLIRGGRAIELSIALDSRAGPLSTTNILIERGYYSYVVVLTFPRAWSKAYAPVLKQMLSEIRLVDPKSLEESRRLVARFPGMSSARVEIADQFAAIGEVDAARSAYQQALQSLPGMPEALFGVAKLTRDYGGDYREAEHIARDLYRERGDEPALALLLADLRQRLGQFRDACAVLQETLDLTSDGGAAEGLRARLRGLRCRPFADWSDAR